MADVSPNPTRDSLSPAQAIAELIAAQRSASGTDVDRRMAAVHLRVGDVLEACEASVTTLLCSGGGAGIKWSRTGTNDTRFTVLCPNCRPYIMPVAYYSFVAARLQALQVGRITLVAASSYNLTRWFPGYRRSCDYIRRVADAFTHFGFDVHFRLGHSPDDDLAFFTSVGVIVVGGGGFSGLAADVAVAAGNVTILHPVLSPSTPLPPAPRQRADSELLATAATAAAANTSAIKGACERWPNLRGDTPRCLKGLTRAAKVCPRCDCVRAWNPRACVKQAGAELPTAEGIEFLALECEVTPSSCDRVEHLLENCPHKFHAEPHVLRPWLPFYRRAPSTRSPSTLPVPVDCVRNTNHNQTNYSTICTHVTWS